ncbi:uncharacterized protein LOC103857527 [Brassica rapa]|uniref:Uncharacterized protein n=2 Tax=Brassica TaxID=3705 RepID=A0A3P6A6U8_BRACM|nr:uncharacterized protein LOC103857527 [Brassica rapa]XP_013740500.1 uncharacterized protein BNAA03G15790D [Brassica napus]KAH0932647.1 hypothetical protein HID58_009764 [Brassica napus]CAF2122712.1 unnamed protein product [Brassica napus]CAG7880553.1 unnamed protein product [Brassica rapa]VDC79948.1 unnamed protein product [Brassica rapa]
MRGSASLVTLNHKILRPCRKLLIRITKSCPRRQTRHLKLKKASSSSSSKPGNKVTKVVALFFLSFHKKKQKKEKMKRLNELRSYSHAVSDQKKTKKKASKQESSKKKVFPSRITMSWLGQGKGNNTHEVPQDHDPRRDSTSAFIP